MDGPLYSSHDPNKVMKCWRGLAPHVLKSLTRDEHAHVAAWETACGGESLPPAIVPFVIIVEGSKPFLLMPWYLHTLSVMPFISADAARDVVRSLSNALDFIHGKGFAHCDVKSSNVCVDYRGDAQFVLVDLGSIVPFGKSAYSTEAYVPTEFELVVSSAQLDWWMLAVTIVDKLEGGLPIGTGRRLSKGAVIECLQRLAPDVWVLLAPRCAAM